jgi:plasmid maintenance system killer protein
VIDSFKHKGLQELFEKGTSSKLQKALAERALGRLDAIDTAKTPEALMFLVLISMDFRASQSATACMSMGHVASPLSGRVRTQSRLILRIITRSE